MVNTKLLKGGGTREGGWSFKRCRVSRDVHGISPTSNGMSERRAPLSFPLFSRGPDFWAVPRSPERESQRASVSR